MALLNCARCHQAVERIESSALDTRVAWVRDLLDRVTVDGREEHAVAIWRTASDDGVNRSDSVSSWLRR